VDGLETYYPNFGVAFPPFLGKAVDAIPPAGETVALRLARLREPTVDPHPAFLNQIGLMDFLQLLRADLDHA
jgi:hypothetical protein